MPFPFVHRLRLIGRVEQQVTFPEVDPEKIARDLDIRHRAARARPPHAMPTATALDLNEVMIEAYHRDLAAEGSHRAENMFIGATARGDELARVPEPDFCGARGFAEQALAKHKTNSAPGIINEAREVADVEHEKNDFKDAHRLNREPRAPAPFYAVLLGTTSAIVLEALCNMNAIAAGLPGGLVAGLATAATLAAANVGAGFAAGFASREILHISPWHKVLGGMAVAAYLALLAHWAALLGYYREMLIEHPEAAGKMAVQTLRAYGVTGTFFSIEGAVLIGVTLGFGVLAMLSVFAIRDPYPGYARLGQRLRAARVARAKAHADYRDGIDRAVQPILAAVSSGHDAWIASRAALRQHIADIKAVIAAYRRFGEKVRHSVHQVCSRYRQLLAIFAGHPIPQYSGTYDLGKPLDLAPINAKITEWEGILPDAVAIAVAEKKLGAAQAAIRGVATDARNAAEAFFEDCAQRAKGHAVAAGVSLALPLRLPAPQLAG